MYHAVCTLLLNNKSENIVYYKLSNYYAPRYESGIFGATKFKVKLLLKTKVSTKDKLAFLQKFLKRFGHL